MSLRRFNKPKTIHFTVNRFSIRLYSISRLQKATSNSNNARTSWNLLTNLVAKVVWRLNEALV